MQKRKTIKDKKFIDELKNRYAKIPMWTNEIVCKGEVAVKKDIWTNKQKAYLDNKFDSIDKKFDAIDKKFDAIDQRFEKLEKSIDKRFEAVDQRFNKLENQVKQNADGINQIIQILARNGMR